MKTNTARTKPNWLEIALCFLWVWILPIGWLVICYNSRSKYDFVFLSILPASNWLLSLLVYFRIGEFQFLRKMRKETPRGNFFVLFDTDDEVQAMKVKAHCSETPQQFEAASMDLAMRFYNEGFATANSAQTLPVKF